MKKKEKSYCADVIAAVEFIITCHAKETKTKHGMHGKLQRENSGK